jgi:hypothetical protein
MLLWRIGSDVLTRLHQPSKNLGFLLIRCKLPEVKQGKSANHEGHKGARRGKPLFVRFAYQCLDIVRDGFVLFAVGVGFGRAVDRGEGEDAGPDGEVVILGVVFGATSTDLGGDFVEFELENSGAFEFLIGGRANVGPASGEKMIADDGEGVGLGFGIGDLGGATEDDDGTVIHGRVEARAGKDESVDEGDGDAAVDALFEVAQHATGCGAVEIDGVAFSSEKSGNDDGLAVGDESDVADKGFIEDGIDGFAIVVAAFGQTPDAGAVGRSVGGHDSG